MTDWGLACGGAVWQQAFSAQLAPPAVLSVPEWADAHRMLARKGASEPGRFRSSRTPYVVEPLALLSAHDPTERVVLMWAAQVATLELKHIGGK